MSNTPSEPLKPVSSRRPEQTADVLLKMLQSHLPVSLMMDLKSVSGTDSEELYASELKIETPKATKNND